MCLRNDQVAFVAAVAALIFVAGTARADDVGLYLEQHGLKQLLAVHLEQQLERGGADDKGDIILRLASLYADLLETVNDPAGRVALEERSRRLLQQAPANSADELRLALIRASYRSAEKIAENHRLRLASAEEVQTAKDTFTSLVPQLAALRQQLGEAAELADRKLSRAGGTEAVSLADSGEQARGLHSQCIFLNAWTLYYQSWLNQRPENARAAESLFAQLLSTESSSPRPQDVSVDLRSTEAVARSILGMGLCKSLTSSTATAIEWIELLDNVNTFEALREQAPVWKMVIYLGHGEFQQVRDVLKSQKSETPTPVAWLRLIAVYGLEDASHDRQSAELASYAVTELASRGELEQVLDLANRYGVEALGSSGFALQYVGGVLKYQAARKAHGSDQPSLESKLNAMYEEAAAQLKSAIHESDASKYPTATAACRKMIAWCAYFESKFLDARAAFEEAAATLTGDDASEALWMAIVSLDKLVDAGGGPELRTQLAAITDRFLSQYPSSQHAPRLRLRRTVLESNPSPETVRALLAIPPNSDVYNVAQRRASDMLYQLFRNTSGQARIDFANQFLTVAVPLMGANAREADLVDKNDAKRLIARCRQVLEIALSEGVERLVAARTAFDALKEIKEHPSVDLSDAAAEIDCRRVQERLFSEDPFAAGQIADRLWQNEPGSIWTRIAERAMFKQAYAAWKSAAASPKDRDDDIERVVRYGGRVLHEFKDAQEPFDQPGALSYHVAVAEASMQRWRQTGDDERGRAALYLYGKLLDKKPNNAQYLRAMAELAERFGDSRKSLDCWRRLVAGHEPWSDEWYEAKFNQLRLLSSLDPAFAREVMDQHKQINPELGPEPWGSRIRAIDNALAKMGSTLSVPATSPDGGGAAQTAPAEGSPA